LSDLPRSLVPTLEQAVYHVLNRYLFRIYVARRVLLYQRDQRFFAVRLFGMHYPVALAGSQAPALMRLPRRQLVKLEPITRAARILVLELAYRAVKQLTAAIYKYYPLADLFYVVHIVRSQYDGRAQAAIYLLYTGSKPALGHYVQPY